MCSTLLVVCVCPLGKHGIKAMPNHEIVLNAQFNNNVDLARFYAKAPAFSRIVSEDDLNRGGAAGEVCMIDDDLCWVSYQIDPAADIEAERVLFRELAQLHNAESIALDFYGEDQMYERLH